MLCPLPSERERTEILTAHSRRLAVAKDADFARVAPMTQFFSGADLKALLTNAELIAINESSLS